MFTVEKHIWNLRRELLFDSSQLNCLLGVYVESSAAYATFS